MGVDSGGFYIGAGSGISGSVSLPAKLTGSVELVGLSLASASGTLTGSFAASEQVPKKVYLNNSSIQSIASQFHGSGDVDVTYAVDASLLFWSKNWSGTLWDQAFTF
jgi:hypothetical protein